MGLSRAEYGEWKKEHTSIEYEELLGKTDASIIVMVMGTKTFIGLSVLENEEELLECLENNTDPEGGKFVIVPRWLAHNEGWEDDEPPE